MKNYMKLKKYLLRGFVLCLCAAGSFTGSACSANNAKDEKPAPIAKEIISSAKESRSTVSVSQPIQQDPVKKQKQKVTVKKQTPAKGINKKQKVAPAKQEASVNKQQSTPDRKKQVVKRQKPANKKAAAPKSANKRDKTAVNTKKDAAKKQASTSKSKKQTSTKGRRVTSSESNKYIALKTNLAYHAIGVQNLAVEFQCGKRFSLELPVMWSFWDWEQEHGIRTFSFQPEGRYWFGQVGKGHFVGAHAHLSFFSMRWEKNRYQDTGRPLLGAGVSYGYVQPLTGHLKAEFTFGAGYANIKYDTFYNVDNGALLSTRTRNYWGITRVGLSLIYQF